MKLSTQACIAVLAMFVFASCTKVGGYLKPYNPNDTTVTGQNNPGGGPGTGGSSDSTYKGTVTNNYQPDSVGSQWTYQVHQVWNFAHSTFGEAYPAASAIYGSSQIDTTITYHVQALGTISAINGQGFQNFSNDFGGGFLYSPAVAVSNGSYNGVDQVWEIQWLGGSSFGGFSLNDDTLVYLKEQPTGTTWGQTTVIADGFGGYDTTVYSFSIKATGLTRAVNNINYPNVIQVESKTTPNSIAQLAAYLSSQSGYDFSTTTEYYFAKNVGLIEEDLSEPFMGITVTVTLQASIIK